MSKITGTETLSLMEAYQAVYSSQQSLEEEIFESVAYALISQGYTATDVLEYFVNTDDEVIIEDIISLSEEQLIIESVVSEEYIKEQYQILNEAVPAIAAGLSLGARALAGAGARRTAGVVLKRMAGPGVRKAVGGAVKNIGGAVGKVKDLAKGALNKLPGGSGGKLASGLKTAGKWALGGAAFEAGSRGVKALMGDKDSSAKKAPAGPPSLKAKQDYAKSKGKYYSSSDQKTYKNYNDALAARNSRRGVKPTPAPAAPSASATPAPAASATPAPAASATPAKSKVVPTKPSGSDTKLTGMQQWAKSNPTLAAKVKPGQSGYDEISATRTKPGPNEKKDQTPTTGPKTTPEQDKGFSQQAMKDVQAELERQKNKNSQKPQAVNSSYEYDAYDLVLEYLFSQGHADTIEEAHYVMMEMNAEMIQNILEETTTQRLARRASEKANEPGAKSDYKPQGPGLRNPRSRASILNQIAGRARTRDERGVDSQYGEGTSQHSEQPRRGGRRGRGSQTDRPGTANMPNPNRKPKQR